MKKPKPRRDSLSTFDQTSSDFLGKVQWHREREVGSYYGPERSGSSRDW